MKPIFTILILSSFIICNGQIANNKYAPFEKAFYSKRNADSLINKGIYYQFTTSNDDFRTIECKELLSKKYHYILLETDNSGCLPESFTRSVDSMPWFENYMTNKLIKLNGLNWKEKYIIEVEQCSNTICGTKNEIDSFFSTAQFVGGLMFEINSSTLNPISKCILDHTIISYLKKYPTLKIEVSGFMTVDEIDKTGKLSMARAQNVIKYIVSKGISKNRLTAKNHKYGSLNISDLENCIRQNRIVRFSGSAS